MTFDLKCSIIYVYQVVGGVSYSVGKLDYIDFRKYEIVRFLILNRLELEISTKESSVNDSLTPEDIMCIYISLDDIIERCNFNEKRMLLLNKLFKGIKIDRDNRASQRMLLRIIQDINDKAMTDRKVWCG